MQEIKNGIDRTHLNTTPEQLTQYLNYNEKGNDTPRRADPTPPARNR